MAIIKTYMNKDIVGKGDTTTYSVKLGYVFDDVKYPELVGKTYDEMNDFLKIDRDVYYSGVTNDDIILSVTPS
jgi:hypothetical protein